MLVTPQLIVLIVLSTLLSVERILTVRKIVLFGCGFFNCTVQANGPVAFYILWD